MHLPGADKTAERSKDLHAEVLESAEGEGRVSWGHLTPTHSLLEFCSTQRCWKVEKEGFSWGHPNPHTLPGSQRKRHNRETLPAAARPDEDEEIIQKIQN